MRRLDDAQLPPALLPVTEHLRQQRGAVTSPSVWIEWPDSTLSISIDVHVAGNGSFPNTSRWHLVISRESFAASIDFYPDSESGPSITYPHQNAVGEETSRRPWRDGDPCLGSPRDAWGERLGGTSEPSDLADRLIWMLRRFELWCLAAGKDRLHLPGDHFEMPALPGSRARTCVGFFETTENLSHWLEIEENAGFASLTDVSSFGRALAVQDWRSFSGEILAAPDWGTTISSASPAGIPCVWLRLSSLPIIGAWQLPRTYAELNNCLDKDGHDLGDIFVTLGRSMRRVGDTGLAMLMMGFPIPSKFGSENERIHWIGIQDIPLKRRKSYLKGFRNNDKSREYLDRHLASSRNQLAWVKCENWAPDQVRSRLHQPQAMVDPLVLLIGAGSLGGHVADSLARSGITRIEVQDPDILLAGNLCRHVLDQADIGKHKATALADRLNRIQPDIRARSSVSSFPDRLRSDRPYDEYDVILDCSGENSVLRAIGKFPWTREKIFVSLSVTWAAKGLLSWSSDGTALPAAYVIDRFEKLIEMQGDVVDRTEIMEGIGCWHPVFPANPADVQLWASIGARFCLETISSREDRCGIHKFDDHGGIEYVRA